MALQTPNDYYSDEDNFGLYQYVTLSEVVNALMLETQDDDSYLKGTKRAKILYHAKQGLRKLSLDVANDVLAFEITVPDSLVWALPQDYVNYVRISVVGRNPITGSFELHPLDINYKMHVAIGYLQDNNAEILFDNDGYILQADSSNAIAHPYKRYSICPVDNLGNNPTKDTSKYSKYGEFSIDERRGIIVFSSDMADKEVVIEYVSDGLQAELSGGEVYLHKHLKEALEDFVYYECISRKKNVPNAEKYRANNKYKSSRHKAVLARSDFDLMRISKAVDVANKIL